MIPPATLSRRSFARLAAGVAAATALPWKDLEALPAAGARPIRLSANENPFGPSPAAREAIRLALADAGRYPDEPAEEMLATVARLHGVREEQVLVGAGSGEILKWAAVTFIGPGRRLVEADPTFEDLSRHTRLAGGEVTRVPLNGRFEHDLPRMLEAARRADLVYLCNPNNPTATITPAASLREFVAAVPAPTLVLVDEAYHHYVTSPDYGSLMDLVPRHPNLIVARTFSKIFGMAGLRCGYCVSSEETIGKMAAHQGWSSVSALTLAAARASLGDEMHVARHRDRNLGTRSFVRTEVERLGRAVLPSEANFVMIDMGRDVTPVIASLRDRGIEVGRRFPAMPQYLRVTIGTPEEMKSFVEEFARVVRAAG
jgi:histidinol-phosphate aminotransferase